MFAKKYFMIKKMMLYKIVLLLMVFILSTGMVSEDIIPFKNVLSQQNELLYDNVWGTIYHAEAEQCDDTPTITGNGWCINPEKASNHRWIAISQGMLDDAYREKLLNNPNIDRFKGKIEYGDTIWVESPYKEINGWWVVCDAKNKRYFRSIDFLQTKGDSSLFGNNKRWSGRFENIKIYRTNKTTSLV